MYIYTLLNICIGVFIIGFFICGYLTRKHEDSFIEMLAGVIYGVNIATMIGISYILLPTGAVIAVNIAALVLGIILVNPADTIDNIALPMAVLTILVSSVFVLILTTIKALVYA